MTFDLLIRGGTLIRPEGRVVSDIAIQSGRIERTDAELSVDAKKEVDARGQILLPGLVDAHVHLRDPGGTHKEDFHSGTLAAAAGGITTVLDMPNTHPPTIDRGSLQEKRALAARTSVVDFGLFLGATRDNIGEICRAEAKENFAAVKVYMGSTTGSLLLNEDERLRELFVRVKKLVCVHAEDEEILRARALELKAELSRPLHNEARPPRAAMEATARALAIATETLHPIHLCHVTTEQELRMVACAPEGLVTAEATPHHLLLNEDAEAQLGTLVKVNPPLRSQRDKEALWQGIEARHITLVATDHAPHTREEKERPYWEAPSGIPGLDTSLITLLHAVRLGYMSLERLVELAAEAPAQRFGIERKGRLEPGYDADIVMLDPGPPRCLSREDLYTRCGWSPFLDWRLPPKPARVWIRGTEVARDGKVTNARHQGREVSFTKKSCHSS